MSLLGKVGARVSERWCQNKTLEQIRVLALKGVANNDDAN